MPAFPFPHSDNVLHNSTMDTFGKAPQPTPADSEIASAADLAEAEPNERRQRTESYGQCQRYSVLP